MILCKMNMEYIFNLKIYIFKVRSTSYVTLIQIQDKDSISSNTEILKQEVNSFEKRIQTWKLFGKVQSCINYVIIRPQKGRKTHNFKYFALCKSIDTTKCVQCSKVIQKLCTAGSKRIRRVSNVNVHRIGFYSKVSRIDICK